ncbi:amidase [Bowmanella dokdonensis]|uniref:Amidase n=1 Tax=Bowmanella dokdonensis TaxID=751969 RepID=A0A939DN47_9ALTE|nr:amidase [Bowmanella dokdonensis]MBN7825282.1 amidase [Bowmanella dokdonensis]
MQPYQLSATQLLEMMRQRELSPVELMQSYQQRINQVNDKVNAFAFEFPQQALAAARQAEQDYISGHARRLSGLAVAIKDETYIAGQITTNGSLCLKDAVAQSTDPAPAALMAEGAIVHGRTTTPECSTAAVTWSRIWGVSRNPWNLALTCGGSSGGSAIAVASGMASFANGTDIGGSLRIPAAFCGLYGYKPPHGRVAEIPPFNIDPYCHHGLLTRSLDDLQRIYPLMTGPNWIDSHSFVPRDKSPARSLSSLRVAVSSNLGFYQVDQDIRANLEQSALHLQQAGVAVEFVDLDWDDQVIETAKIHQRALMGMLLRRNLDKPENRPLFTPYLAWYLDRVAELSADDIFEANLHVCRMWEALAKVFKRFDALICPTLATTRIAADFDYSQHQVEINDQVVDANKGWFMTYPFNTLGQCPALSMPNGFCQTGVPSSLQIVGRPYQEQTLFTLAEALSHYHDWARWPPFN